MKQYSLFILLAILAFTNTDCKNNPVSPPDNTPGRRDYTWTVDTLKANPGDLFYMSSLWGSSPTDIWAVGSADASDLSIWHYDGINWTQNNSILSSNLQCIFGFAQNNVWAIEAPGTKIYNFNGLQWSNVYNYLNSETYLYAVDIWGEASNNIYIVGSISSIDTNVYRGTIMHYEGKNWNFVSIPDYRVEFTHIRRGIKENTNYYLMATRFESTGDTNKIYEFDGSNLKEIYSSPKGASACEMEGKMYFPIEKKIFKYENNQFVVWKDFSSTTYRGWICGRNEIDFFALASDGLAHYNGTNLKTIYSTTSPISGILVFSKDIFFIINFRIIVHGKLQ
jgi:hypothetical protein